MRLLLDTNVVLRQYGDIGPYPARLRAVLAEASEVAVSVVCFVEIGIKVSTGRLTVPAGIPAMIAEAGGQVLAVTPEHGLALADLPLHHRDPFDRLLIAQAQADGYAIVTSDRAFRRYDVDVIAT